MPPKHQPVIDHAGLRLEFGRVKSKKICRKAAKLRLRRAEMKPLIIGARNRRGRVRHPYALQRTVDLPSPSPLAFIPGRTPRPSLYQPTGDETAMTFDQIATATLHELTDELAAAGVDSTQTDIIAAREAVACLLNELSLLELRCSHTNDVIDHFPTDEQACGSCHTPEGHIYSGGRKCYVAQS